MTARDALLARISQYEGGEASLAEVIKAMNALVVEAEARGAAEERQRINKGLADLTDESTIGLYGDYGPVLILGEEVEALVNDEPWSIDDWDEDDRPVTKTALRAEGAAAVRAQVEAICDSFESADDCAGFTTVERAMLRWASRRVRAAVAADGDQKENDR